MTGAVTASGGDLFGAGADDAADRFAALLVPTFLTEAGWNAETWVLSSPAQHPLLGWPVCRAEGCVNTANGPTKVCTSCRRRLIRHGLRLEDLAVLPPVARVVQLGTCSVLGCPRVWYSSRRPLCYSHLREQRELRKLSLEEFLAHPDVRPRPGFGRCRVVACTRDRISGKCPYCDAHYKRFLPARKTDPGLDEQHWQATESAIPEAGQISLRGLPELVVNQVLYGLQQRTLAGRKTKPPEFRLVCDELRRQQVSTVEDLVPFTDKGKRPIANSFIGHVQRAFLTPETEKVKDTWELSALGFTGRLHFMKITQRWLRDATKRWALDNLPKRRGDNARAAVQDHVTCVARLSESLRVRPDRGDTPTALGRADIDNFLNRLAFLESTEKLSAKARCRTCRQLRMILLRVRTLGLNCQGEPAAGLPDDFAILVDDVPAEPEPKEPGRDLPPEIIRQLCEHLPKVEDIASRETRVAFELAIDTGRRPDDICELPWDCLQRDDDGQPVLAYDNHKAQRLGRRLPIPEATAELITEQKKRVRQRYPDAPLIELKLLPSPVCNPKGDKAINDSSVSERHRAWVDSLPPLLRTDGTEFDKAQVFLYAYRHTYAQRHADAGVPVDVLRELLDHRMLDTTKRYYRVGHERRREAVGRVTALQFDRHGDRVWRQAKALLDTEYARRVVGEVVVPFGVCSEPSNVKAGGHDCPYRFRCVGCDHFRTDVSYLPDLQAHLDDLLRNRERLLAASEVDAWAKAEAMPSQEEISRIRRLIGRIKNDLADLTAEERAQIDQAVSVVRAHRKVMLGMPRLRQPLPDVRPERLA
jgi:integrase